MKVIIAGSRTFTDYDFLKECVDSILLRNPITEIISGEAKGADKLGEKWARENKIPVKRFPADWNKFNKAAGVIRNEQMAYYGDYLLVFWDGKSKGTKHMITFFKGLKKSHSVHRF